MGSAQFGLSTAHIAHQTVAEAVDRCRALGVDAVEFFVAEYAVDTCREARRLAGEAGLAVDYHAPWHGPYDLGFTDRDTAFQHLEQAIARAHLIGARHLICHLGRYSLDRHDGRDRALEQIIDITQALLPALHDTGIALCYEDNTLCHDPNPLGDQPRDFALLFDAIGDPHVGMTLDTGHAHITGHTRAYLEQFGRRVYYVHVDDNDGVGDQHVPPSSGTIDWETLFEWLAYYGAEGSFGIEFNEQFVADELPFLRDLAGRHDWAVPRGR